MTDEIRRMPVRSSDPLELPEPYTGWHVRFRVNAPMGVIDELQTALDKKAKQDTPHLYEALAAICLESDYVDDAGAPIDVTKPADWAKTGADLIVETIRLFRQAIADPFKTTSSGSAPSGAATEADSPMVTA